MKTCKQAFADALQECWILEARIRNRDPGPARQLEQANQALRVRIEELETNLFRILGAEGVCLQKEEEACRLEVVRRQTLEFMKTLKVDPKLWQDLASS